MKVLCIETEDFLNRFILNQIDKIYVYTYQINYFLANKSYYIGAKETPL